MVKLYAISALAAAAVALTASSVSAERSGINCRTLKNPIEMGTQRCICTPCHVCEFSFRKFSCKLIVNDDTDTSDGSNVAPVQSSLNSADWFLNEDEITVARGGVARSSLQVSSSNNEVIAYAAPAEFFTDVYKDLEATMADDKIYLAAWSTCDIPFDPVNDPTGATSSFEHVMGRAVERGADFRAIVHPNLLEKDQNIAIRDYMHGLPEPKANGPARFVFDDRMPSATSSQHQKTVMMTHGKQPISYVGGVDLTADRWDTLKHDQTELRKATNIDRGANGWLDTHLRIKGPAAIDIGNNFLDRWNADTKPSTGRVDALLKFKNPEYSDLPALDADGALDLSTSGKHDVQVVRTFSCKYEHYDSFAPKGEKTYLHARIKAIRQAQNYIYIEDQYFILVPELLEALLEVLPRLQRVIVVVQRTLANTKPTGYEKYMFDMVAPIQEKFPNKFQLYSTKEDMNLYIHSKLVIIDDVYVSMGSGNWNRRSMTSDSEIGANVVDTNSVVSPDGVLVNTLARDLRIRKFMEHTGKSYEELDAMTFIDAANAFDTAAADANTIIQPFEVQELPTFVVFTDTVRQAVDPDDICGEY